MPLPQEFCQLSGRSYRTYLRADPTTIASPTEPLPSVHRHLPLHLADGYWRTRFGGDPTVLGRRIMVDGNPREIIGVLPASFQCMDRRISMMIPLRFDRNDVHLGNFSYQGVARLKPGVTLQQASA